MQETFSNGGIIMKLHNGLDVQHLMKMLADALLKEREKWKPVHYKSNTGPTVGFTEYLFIFVEIYVTIIFNGKTCRQTTENDKCSGLLTQVT